MKNSPESFSATSTATSSTATAGIKPMTILASTTDAPAGARVANSDDQGSDQEADGDDNIGRSAGEP
jgi:hypothetical protein